MNLRYLCTRSMKLLVVTKTVKLILRSITIVYDILFMTNNTCPLYKINEYNLILSLKLKYKI